MANRQNLAQKQTSVIVYDSDEDMNRILQDYLYPQKSITCAEMFILLFSWLVILITFPISIFVCIHVIREYERGVLFKFGKMKRTPIQPGIIFVVPCTETLFVVDLRTVVYDVPVQEVLTSDAVTISIDAVVYYRVCQPQLAVISVYNYTESTHFMASTSLRNVIGGSPMSDFLLSRDQMALTMQKILDVATDPWGVRVERVEFKNVILPPALQRKMAAEAEAIREARAKIVAAEGELNAAKSLQKASLILATPAAIQLRYLQTMVSVSADENRTIVLPLPLDLINQLLPDKGQTNLNAAGKQPLFIPPVVIPNRECCDPCIDERIQQTLRKVTPKVSLQISPKSSKQVPENLKFEMSRKVSSSSKLDTIPELPHSKVPFSDEVPSIRKGMVEPPKTKVYRSIFNSSETVIPENKEIKVSPASLKSIINQNCPVMSSNAFKTHTSLKIKNLYPPRVQFDKISSNSNSEETEVKSSNVHLSKIDIPNVKRQFNSSTNQNIPVIPQISSTSLNIPEIEISKNEIHTSLNIPQVPKIINLDPPRVQFGKTSSNYSMQSNSQVMLNSDETDYKSSNSNLSKIDIPKERTISNSSINQNIQVIPQINSKTLNRPNIVISKSLTNFTTSSYQSFHVMSHIVKIDINASNCDHSKTVTQFPNVQDSPTKSNLSMIGSSSEIPDLIKSEDNLKIDKLTKTVMSASRDIQDSTDPAFNHSMKYPIKTIVTRIICSNLNNSEKVTESINQIKSAIVVEPTKSASSEVSKTQVTQIICNPLKKEGCSGISDNLQSDNRVVYSPKTETTGLLFDCPDSIVSEKLKQNSSLAAYAELTKLPNYEGLEPFGLVNTQTAQSTPKPLRKDVLHCLSNSSQLGTTNINSDYQKPSTSKAQSILNTRDIAPTQTVSKMARSLETSIKIQAIPESVKSLRKDVLSCLSNTSQLKTSLLAASSIYSDYQKPSTSAGFEPCIKTEATQVSVKSLGEDVLSYLSNSSQLETSLLAASRINTDYQKPSTSAGFEPCIKTQATQVSVKTLREDVLSCLSNSSQLEVSLLAARSINPDYQKPSTSAGLEPTQKTQATQVSAKSLREEVLSCFSNSSQLEVSLLAARSINPDYQKPSTFAGLEPTQKTQATQVSAKSLTKDVLSCLSNLSQLTGTRDVFPLVLEASNIIWDYQKPSTSNQSNNLISRSIAATQTIPDMAEVVFPEIFSKRIKKLDTGEIKKASITANPDPSKQSKFFQLIFKSLKNKTQKTHSPGMIFLNINCDSTTTIPELKSSVTENLTKENSESSKAQIVVNAVEAPNFKAESSQAVTKKLKKDDCEIPSSSQGVNTSDIEAIQKIFNNSERSNCEINQANFNPPVQNFVTTFQGNTLTTKTLTVNSTSQIPRNKDIMSPPHPSSMKAANSPADPENNTIPPNVEVSIINECCRKTPRKSLLKK